MILLCEHGVFQGREAVRRSAERLEEQIPKGEFAAKHVSGEYAFLEWRARSKRFEVKHGCDTFVIRGSKIVMQTVSCRLSQTN